MENLKFNTQIHHVILWIYNWKKKDFQKAFENSSLGWDYQWNKLQEKIKNGKNPTAAIVEIILNMDDIHQEMLFDFILNKKYKNSIKNMIDFKKLFD